MSKVIRAMKKVYWKGRKKIKKLPPVKAVKKYMGRKRKDKLLYETLPFDVQTADHAAEGTLSLHLPYGFEGHEPQKEVSFPLYQSICLKLTL